MVGIGSEYDDEDEYAGGDDNDDDDEDEDAAGDDITVAMMSTKMLLEMIRMTRMLMNMIMTTMLVFTRRRRRHNLFLNGFIYTYSIRSGAAAARWADAAAACMRYIQTGLMRAPAEVGLIQTGLWPMMLCRHQDRGHLAEGCWGIYAGLQQPCGGNDGA